MTTLVPVPSPRPLPAAPQQEFLRSVPAPLNAETIELESLVHHAWSVEADTPLELAHREFGRRDVDFMAVVREGRVVGLCARSQLGFIMGSRFGFALYSQQPVEAAQTPMPIIIPREVPLRQVMDQALSRQGEHFCHDVILIDAEHRLLGLIRIETLAQLQSRLVREQVEALTQQHEAQRRQNLELFQVNHALRQSQGLYLGLFDSHTLGIALLDSHGGIHEHNHRLDDLLGQRIQPSDRRSIVPLVAERDRARFLALLESQATGSMPPTTREYLFNLPAIGARQIRCSMGWIRETGQICACLDDVTEQRALEGNMRQQEKQALLDTLVGGIAHELNNKLTPVRGFAELLTTEVGPHARGYLETITQSVSEAAEIISQLLQLAKPAVPALHAVDAADVVRQTLRMLRFQLRETKCQLHLTLPAGPLWVFADTGQLKQVVLNLVLNALQAMDGRTGNLLSIEVRGPDDEICLVVEDNGPGIAPEIIGRIFDPFFTTKSAARGTGLGLSICSGIIRQFAGQIRVESQPGAGARFTVTLPQAPADAALDAPGELEASAPIRLSARSMRALVIDDEHVIRCLVQEALRMRFGCHVDLAANGAEGLAALGRHRYQLVISDIRMPEMNGVELYARMLEDFPEQCRRVTFITGHAGDAGLEGQIATWGVPVIAKPFSVTRLAEVCAPILALAG